MRHRFAMALLTTLILGSVGATLSKVSAAGPPSFAVGGGEQVAAGITKHFAFSAQDGPNGPSGHAVFTQDDPTTVFGNFTLQGHVTCVTVVHNNATIGVGIEKGTGTSDGQGGIFIYVTDNGDGASSVPDTFTN